VAPDRQSERARCPVSAGGMRHRLLLPSLSVLLLPVRLCIDLAVTPSCSRSWSAFGGSCTARPLGRPRIVRQSSSGMDALTPAEAYLVSWGLSEEQMSKLRSRSRWQKLTGDVDSRIKPTLKWLSELGLSDVDIQKVVTSYPRIFSSSRDNALNPHVQWLSDLGMDDSQVARTIVRFPRLFSYSLANKCRPVLQYLRDLGFADSQIVRVLERVPMLLSYSLKRLVHRMTILKAQGPLTEVSVGKMTLTDARFAARHEHLA